MESVRIPSYFSPHFPTFGLNMERSLRISPYSVRMRENTDQNNSEYGHFLQRYLRDLKTFEIISNVMPVLLLILF